MRGMDVLAELPDRDTWPLLIALVAYLVFMNIWTAFAFRLDKQRAVTGEWRVPEATLLFLSAVGGWFGAKFAQRRYRHKTRKQPFRTFLNLIGLLQVAFILALTFLPASGVFDDIAIAFTPTPKKEPAKPERVMPRRFGPGSDSALLRP